MAFITSPLEQFSIIRYIPIRIGIFDFSFTNTSVTMFLIISLLLFVYWCSFDRGGRLVPTVVQSSTEMIYAFIRGVIEDQVGKDGKKYEAFILSVFLFVLACNMFGMIPYAFTVTSHIAVTFALSMSIFIGVTTIGLLKHGLHFFSFFWPSGAPLALAPLLVPLEIVSYSFRSISLGVRLFANMMAGHTLVHILAGFSWSMAMAGGFLLPGALIPFGIVFALTGLELGVGILQAYVFTILTCIYLKDVLELH